MIYLDHAASTPPAPEALEAMTQVARDHFANPSSAHALGAAAARRLEQAREEVAAWLGGRARRDRLHQRRHRGRRAGRAGRGRAPARGRHLVVTAIEHPAVLRSLELLAARGFEVTLVPPGADGRVAAEDVVAAVRPETAVVRGHAGQQRARHPAAGGRDRAAPCAAGGLPAPTSTATPSRPPGSCPSTCARLGVDTLALSAHKLHGPGAPGALWVRPGARLAPLWDGGRQERGLRSGTENLPALVGFGRAAALARAAAGRRRRAVAAAARSAGERRSPRRLARRRGRRCPRARPARRTSPAGVPGLPAEPILHALEARGVYASAGSACASRTRGPSHVLEAIGVDDDAAVLRFSLARTTTDAEVVQAAAALREAVAEVAAVARDASRARRRAEAASR